MLRDSFEDVQLELNAKIMAVKLHPNQYAKELLNLYERQLSWFELHELLL